MSKKNIRAGIFLKAIYFGATVLSITPYASAACDSATITGSCVGIVLPSAAGNTAYTVDQSSTIISGGAGQFAMSLNGIISSISNNGIIGSASDQGTIFSASGLGGISGNFVNNGSILGNWDIEIYFGPGTFINGSLINNGTIAGGNANGLAIYFDDNSALSGSFLNSVNGIISSQGWSAIAFGELNKPSGSSVMVTNFNNAGIIRGYWHGVGLYGTTIGTLTNSGIIEGSYYGGGSGGNGLNLSPGTSSASSTINILSNSGSISSSDSSAVKTSAGSSIGIFSNTGSIYSGGTFGIDNQGSINILSNAQGSGNAAGALTLTGNLPSTYKIILGSDATTYGKLIYATGSGVSNSLPTFGVDGGVVKANLYKAVLTGVTAVSAGTVGTYSGLTYQLVLENGSTNTWDLLFPNYYLGPSIADTQASLFNTATALQNTYTLQNSILANSFAYDCNVFGANNFCVSAGGRNTAVSAANGLNNTSGLLIAGYRLSPNYRIGAYADQNLSVNNAGSTVNLGNNAPLIGLFGAWNERSDDLGAEVKVSAAYGQKNTTITRQVVGTSEAGSGSSQLNSQGAQITAKYGFGVMKDVVVSPYAGVRYTQNNMAGYTEASSSAVTAPLTYSALNTNATTVLAGVGATYKGIPQTTLVASAGVESDTNTQAGSINATGVSNLTPVNFNSNPVKTRATASLGAYYDIEKNQRLGVTGIYRQEAYQAVSTTTVMATYTVGF